MEQTLWGILAVSLVSGTVLGFGPKNSRMLPYIQFLLSLVLLIMLLSPMISVMNAIRNRDLAAPFFSDVTIDSSGQFYRDAVTADAIRRTTAALSSLISAETGIAAEDMEIALTTASVGEGHTAEIAVVDAEVTLFRRSHRIAAEKIRSLVERTLLCPCTVVFWGGEDA